MEIFHYFLRARAVQRDGTSGWECEYFKGTKKTINEAETMVKWEPAVVNAEQFLIFNNLCMGRDERINDPKLIEYIEKKGHNMEEFVRSLLATGMIALEGDTLRLTTYQCQCAILPDGRFVAAENNTGRFTRWFVRYIKERKTPNNPQ